MTEPLNLTDEQQRALVAFAQWVIEGLNGSSGIRHAINTIAVSYKLADGDRPIGFDQLECSAWLKDALNK